MLIVDRAFQKFFRMLEFFVAVTLIKIVTGVTNFRPHFLALSGCISKFARNPTQERIWKTAISAERGGQYWYYRRHLTLIFGVRKSQEV